MTLLFCTCNGTLPLTEEGLRQCVPQGSSVVLSDTLCTDIERVLPDLPEYEQVFIGCAKKEPFFQKLFNDKSHFQEPVVCASLEQLCAGFAAPEADRLSAAYAAASLSEQATKGLAAPRTIEVGRSFLFAGRCDPELFTALDGRLDILLLGDQDGLSDGNVLRGSIKKVQGSIGNFTVTIQMADTIEHLACLPGTVLDRKGRELTLAIDQILLPGGTLPPRRGLYQPTSSSAIVADLLEATAIAAQGSVDTVRAIRYDPKLCAHSYAEQLGCQACITVCPSKAITSEKGILSLNHDHCTGCLGCAAVCPTEAIEARSLPQGPLGSLLTDFAQQTKEIGPLVLRCRKHTTTTPVSDRSVIFPTPHMQLLEATHILAALAAGSTSITLQPCPECADAVRRSYELAREILARQRAESLLSWQEQPSEQHTGTLPSSHPCSWTSKRDDLATFLRPFIEASSGEHPPLAGPFGSVTITADRCTGCGACVEACRTSALQADEQSMTIFTEEISCIGCRLCETICPEKAITFTSGLRWNSDVFETKEAAVSEGFSCGRCGKVFATKGAIAAVMARLANHLEPGQEKILQYCPDCRVIASLTEDTDV